MKINKWLRLATAFSAELTVLGAELAAHQLREPVAPRSDAADLLLAAKIKAEYLRERIRHNAKTQELLGQMFKVQTRALRHLENAPPAILEQAQTMIGAQ